MHRKFIPMDAIVHTRPSWGGETNNEPPFSAWSLLGTTPKLPTCKLGRRADREGPATIHHEAGLFLLAALR